MRLKIRNETEQDYYASELVTRRAFWNKHRPGCNEHYLVHKLRSDPAYIPSLTRVAELDGRIIGLIMYSKARLLTGEGEAEALTFGPLCVEPEFQRLGVGGLLLKTTLALAREEGFKGVIIFGEPDYYPRFGFVPCEAWGITTMEGENFPAFMGYELCEGGLDYRGARMSIAGVFFDLPDEEVELFDKQFPYMQKLTLPTQMGH